MNTSNNEQEPLPRTGLNKLFWLVILTGASFSIVGMLFLGFRMVTEAVR